MNFVKGIFGGITCIWLIPVFFSIHELEEWKILKWYKKYYRNLPDSTNFSVRLHIISFCIISFVLTIVAYYIQIPVIFSLIMIFISVFILLNTIQHIIWTIQIRGYSVGLSTAIICLIITIIVNYSLVIQGYLHPVFYALVILIIGPIIGTIKVNHEMSNEIRNAHLLFIKIEKILKRKK